LPGNASAHLRRGNSHLDKGLLDLALADYNRAIQLNPSDSWAHNNRGTVYDRKKMLDHAIADYSKAVQLSPKYASAFRNRGRVYGKKGLYGLQKADYEKAVQLAPGYAAGLNSLAWLLATCKDANYRDGKRAVELALKAVGTDYDPAYMDTLAAAYAEAGRWEEAAKTQEQALSMLRQQKAPAERVKRYEERLGLFKQKKPYRETE